MVVGRAGRRFAPPLAARNKKEKKSSPLQEVGKILKAFFRLQLSERLEAPFVNNPQVGAGVAGVEAFLFYSFMDTYGPYGA